MAGTAERRSAVAAELLDLEAEALERRGVLRERLPLRGRHLDQDGRQQPLALEPPGGQRLHHPLEEHPFVRHVLIDDRDALVVDRDDERVAELPERDHRPDLDRALRAWPPSRPTAAFAPGGPAGGCEWPGRRDRAVAGSHRLPTVAPASTPGILMGRGSSGRGANGVNWSSGARPCPSASPSARRRTSCTRDCSRKRTSALVGCTLTSTRSGANLHEQVHLRAAFFDRRDAVGLGDGVGDRAVLDDAAVDEDVLRPAHRALIAERRDVAVDA